MSQDPHKKIGIILTKEQSELLEPLESEIIAMALAGKPGMMIGQISHNAMLVGILDNERSHAVQLAMDVTPGIMMDGVVFSPHAMPSASVIVEIANERLRQVIAEGWSAAHDDEHIRFELARAAAAYAASAAGRYPMYWPWDIAWLKPTNPRRDLIKAAALIVAEIERLDRIETPAVPSAEGISDA